MNTGETPRFWRGEDVAIQIGIFDPFGTAVNLANIDFLEVDIFPYPLPPLAIPTNKTYAPYTYLPFPTVPPAPLLSQTIAAVNIIPFVTKRDWVEQISQQVEVIFPWIDTASLNLRGQRMKRFSLVVHGIITGAGDFGSDFNPVDFGGGRAQRKITYGGGLIEVWESGASGVYLPNTVAPLQVPLATIFYIPANNQIPFAVPIQVDGILLVDGILTDVSRGADTQGDFGPDFDPADFST